MTLNALKLRRGRSGRYILLLPLFLAISCSSETLSLFFDIPPPTEAEIAAKAAPKQAPAAPSATAQTGASPVAIIEEAGERPPIEAISNWAEASALLPKDDMDEVDWSAALRDGTIKPRAKISGYADPEAKIFGWDFFFAAEDPESDAFFPHSEHTEWLTCKSCHPSLFPYRELGTDGSDKHSISMDRVFEGEYCGKCHGSVAFALDSCNRCHTKM